MLPQDIIRKKRDGQALSPEEMHAFFDAYLQGDVPDYQAAALLMATYFRGMTFDETIELTRLFIESGARIDLSPVQGMKIDKHSTGGVGDKTSLLIVPICAAAGVSAPMISGRGLGHTGGTLDKLESIPGFRTGLSEQEYVRTVSATGMAMAGQTATFVPLDRRIYALRDVTSTVEILPFIGASIMSKKIAGGADALVLDVKSGSGAFMRERAQARELAELLCSIGTHFGLPTAGILTSMDEPLGRAVGNWVEIVETVDCLTGAPSGDLLEVTCALAGIMIHLGRKAAYIAEGITVAREMVRNGLAYRKFLELVDAQGGDTRVIEDTLLQPSARLVSEVYAERDGYIGRIDGLMIGRIAGALGAGRVRVEDAVDHSAGIVLARKRGDPVEEGDVLCRLYSSRHDTLAPFRDAVRHAFSIGDRAPEPAALIFDHFNAQGFTPWSAVLAGKD